MNQTPGYTHHSPAEQENPMPPSKEYIIYSFVLLRIGLLPQYRIPKFHLCLLFFTKNTNIKKNGKKKIGRMVEFSLSIKSLYKNKRKGFCLFAEDFKRCGRRACFSALRGRTQRRLQGIQSRCQLPELHFPGYSLVRRPRRRGLKMHQGNRRLRSSCR